MDRHPAPGTATDQELPGSVSAFVVARGPTPDAPVECGVRTLATDDLGPGTVTLAVDWSSVNYKDAMVTQPGNRVARIDPLVPGVDLVGTVLRAPAGGPLPGQQVIVHGYDLGVAHHGGFAELARVPESWVVPLPAGLLPRQAATIGTAGFTAALSVDRLERRGLRPGDGPVLVTGASGGVGSMAVALLASRGYEVAASTGKTAETTYLTELGATQVLDRSELVVASERVLGPERWVAAVDCVGGATLATVVRTLRYGGAVAASGLTGGSALDTSVYPFIVRDVSLIGVDTVLTPIGERRRVWDRMVGAWPDHVLEQMVADEIALDGLPPALERLLHGASRGRILVRPGHAT
jgi:acrylyl-CoA reductase (NADPH)